MSRSTRREFLISVALSGAALSLRCRPADDSPAEAHALGAWIDLDEVGGITLRASKLEMGQGIWTTLAILAAEELGVEVERIRVVPLSTAEVDALPAAERRFPGRRILETGSSASVPRSWLPVRLAAAAAREMLRDEAAARWSVALDECRARDGAIEHPPSGRRLGYGELVVGASRRPVPAQPPLRAEHDFRRIGRPTRRIDGGEVATGRARFSLDFRLPGQLFAVLARPPALRSRPTAVRAERARAAPGVVTVVDLGERGVAVVARSTYDALRARDRLEIDWTPGVEEEVSPGPFVAALERALEVAPDRGADAYEIKSARIQSVVVIEHGGELERAAGRTVRAEFATPFQAHAPMEPPNATALLHPEGWLELWLGTQAPHETAERAAIRLRPRPSHTIVHPQRMGGSFGRKEGIDFAAEAAAIAQAVPGVPVQLFWSRADDFTRDGFQPATRHRLEARLDGARISAWRHRIAAPSVERQWPSVRGHDDLVPRAETSGAWNLPYAFPSFRVEYVDPPCPIRLGFWRGIEVVSNSFAVEAFVDELAHAAGVDPIEFRRAHAASTVVSTQVDEPFEVTRLLHCFELAAERSRWGSALGEGRGRGIAGAIFDGRAACATVAEVAIVPGGFRVERIVSVLDCGRVVNPTGLESNAQGAIAWALSALETEITFDGSQPNERSHVDYPVLRLPRMPRAVEIVPVESTLPPSGSGEVPVPTVAPAVINALFDATGRRFRRLPLRPELFG